MKRWMTVMAILGCLVAASAGAQDHGDHQHGKAATAAGGVKGEWNRNLDYAGEKLLQLAEAIPEDKYGWRPSEGVRSVSETLLHAAGANFFIPSFMGAKAPEGMSPEQMKPDVFEKSTVKKAEIVAHLKRSLDYLKSVAEATADADMDTQVKWFLGESSKRELLYFIAAHNHEHLGQMIAYARMNGVVPPWSK